MAVRTHTPCARSSFLIPQVNSLFGPRSQPPFNPLSPLLAPCFHRMLRDVRPSQNSVCERHGNREQLVWRQPLPRLHVDRVLVTPRASVLVKRPVRAPARALVGGRRAAADAAAAVGAVASRARQLPPLWQRGAPREAEPRDACRVAPQV